jgi:DNA-binding CsgD family transcriptional regulator/tetratricopeptide (TPR) repeat protein
VGGETPLLGRATELRALEAALDWVGSRTGGFVLIRGEPGIGKSRVLEELAQRATQREHLVLPGRAAEFERELPFAAWIDALDAYLGTLDSTRLQRMGVERIEDLAGIFPALGDTHAATVADDRFRAHRAVRELLDGLARARGLVLVLDDLHWADEASMELLEALARRPPERGVLIAGGHRPTAALDPLRAALDRAPRAAPLDLGPLSRGDAERLVSADLPSPERAELITEAGGNPFYLEQLARVPGSSAQHGPGEVLEGGFRVPAGVAASIAEEVAALPAKARTLLQGAAAAGEPFDLRLAAAAAGVDFDTALEAIDDALAVDLVRTTPAPDQFLFRHPLVRRAIYASAGERFRLTAHRGAAAALAARGADASARAHHVARSAAPGDDTAIELLVEAADQRMGRAPASAAVSYADALRLLANGDRRRRSELLSRRARALLAAGHLEESHEAMTEALRLVPAGGSVEPVMLLADIELWLGQPQAAVDRLRHALDDLADAQPGAAALLGLRLMLIDRQSARIDAALAHGQEALSAAQRAADEPVLAAVEATFAELAAHVDVATATELHHAAAARVEDLPDERLPEALDALYALGWGAVHLERYEEAVSYFRRGLEVARRAGAEGYVMTLRTEPIEPLIRSGRVSEAIAAADEAVDAARLRRSPRFLWWALWLRSAALARIGELDRSGTDFDEAAVIAAELPLRELVDLWMGYLRAHQLSLRGEHAAAVDALVTAGGGDDLPRIPPMDRQQAWEIMVAAALDRGDLAAARGWVAEAATRASESGLAGLAGYAARVRAQTELAGGDADAAARAAGESAMSFENLGSPLETARSRLLEGECLIAAERGPEAVPILVAAEQSLHDLGAERLRADAARVLRSLGRRTPPRRAAARGVEPAVSTAPLPAAPSLAALSPREREIAALVHRQRTNREIAEELFVSEKTVQTHLRNIFAKLGVSSRVAVALAVQQAGEQLEVRE